MSEWCNVSGCHLHGVKDHGHDGRFGPGMPTTLTMQEKLAAMSPDQLAVNERLQSLARGYSDTKPGECILWYHPKVRVRAYHLGDSTLARPYIERYDCECGKYYWLSDGVCKPVRYRNTK